MSPAPFLKWAGGKTALLPAILERLPKRIETYYEPFLGGGAVFFALARERRFRRAVLNDRNGELVATYRAIRDDVEGVIRALKRLRHSEGDFYRMRERRPRTPATRAARMIYLNRTCFNGLYRVNRDGEFNVPFGRYANPLICDEEKLRAAAAALQGVSLINGPFGEAVPGARPGDAVYFDPPYVPLTRSARFAEYVAAPFGLDEHTRLRDTFVHLTRAGIAAVLSNSDTEVTRELYRGLIFDTVQVPRSISANAAKRGAVPELLVRGGHVS